MQNLAEGGKIVPHCEQIKFSCEPHCMQNFAPSGFSVRQLEQVITTQIP
jgi:hypothetical protein